MRLALVYAAVLSCILLAFGTALYAAVDQYLAAETDQSVSLLAQHVAAAIPPNAPLDAEGLSTMDIDPFTAPGMHVQVLDVTGKPLTHSAGLGLGVLPVSEDNLRLALAGVANYYTANAGGERIRVYQLPLRRAGKVAAVVQVGKSYHDYDLTMTSLGQAAGGGSVLAIVLAGLVGWAVAGRALRPIADMTATARAIALSQGFSQRLPENRKADEVGQLATAFNEMLESLESAYSQQRRFVADASHELRAPLTTIVGNLGFVRQAAELSEAERDEALDDAMAEAQRMRRLVGDLLALARADAGQQENLEAVDLNAVVADLWHELRPRTQGRTLRFTSLAKATVRGDRDRLKQVALIIVDNALKYTPAGGQVEVSVRSQDGQAVLRVRDGGIGIDPEDLPHIFDRFYRADKARARDQGGSGLGLAIAKAIVEHLNGSIDVESTPERGTTFTVRLPAVEPTPSEDIS